MSAHVQHALWAHARGQLSAEQARDVEAHLSGCAECQRVLEQFKAAVVVVKPLEPPVLDDAAWSRIDSKVMAAARKELARGASPFAWLFDNWKAFALVGAAAAILVTFLLAQPKPVAPVVTRAPEQLAKVEPAPGQQKVEPAPVKVEEPAPQLLALSSGGNVKVGDAIATAAGDRTFVALPDGSRAGGVGDSAFTVEKASANEVKLSLARGAMVVAAAHATVDRSFAVNAGEVEVVVVGTRFLVDRAEAVTVVVEEGRVEVAANGQKHLVSAGETLVIDTAGHAERKKAVTPSARAAFKILKVEAPIAAKTTEPSQTAVADSSAGSAQRLSDEDVTEPPVEGGSLPAKKDAGTQFGALTPPPLLLPGDQLGVASSAPAKEEKKFDLLGALKRIDLKNVNLDAPYPPVGMPMSEYRVHQLQRNADRGQCDRVVERADAWMTEFGADPAVKNRAVLAKAVLFTKARCLTKLGRTAEAEKVRAAAETVK